MQKEKPLLSIITVVLNDAIGLERTLSSIVDQGYSNKQLILIDGGSGAATLAVIQKYADYLDYWVSEPDVGIYDAMNKGIKQVKGSWLHFLNAGDVYYGNNSLSTLMPQADDRYSLLYADVYYDDGKTQSLSKQKPLFRWGIFTSINHQGTIYNVKKLGKLLQFDTQYQNSADADLLLDIYYFDKKKAAKKVGIALVVYATGGFSDKNFQNLFPERRKQFQQKLKNPFILAINKLNLYRQERKFKRSSSTSKLLVCLLNKRCDIYGLSILKEMPPDAYTLFLSKNYAEEVSLPHQRIRTYSSNWGFIFSSIFNLPFLLGKVFLGKMKGQYSSAYFPFFHHWILPIMFLCRLLRIKTIFTVHDGQLHLGEKSSLDQRWQNRCIKLADELVFLTKFVEGQTRQHVGFSARPNILPHGINKPDWLTYVERRPRKKPRLLFLGRILPYKGVDLLVEAVAALPTGKYEKLTIAGELRCTLEIPAGKNILLKDNFFSDKKFVDLLNEHDILILPYREGTQSGIISFGIATAIPMICTNVGGFSEQITPKNEAIFTEPTAGGIQTALLRLIENPELYQDLHEALKEKRKEKLWKKTADQILGISSK